MKKNLILGLAFILVFSFITVTGGASKPVSQLESQALYHQDNTYIELRSLMKAIDARVYWVAPTRSAIIVKDSTKVQIISDSPRVKIGDNWVTLKTAPIIVNNKLHIPLELVSALGFESSSNKGKVTVNTGDGLANYIKTAKVGNWGRWGADDEKGAVNLITPEKVVEATQLVKEGKVYQLGREINRNLAGYEGRGFKTSLSHRHDQGTFGENSITYMDDHIDGTMQWATQIDGFAHIGAGNIYYNGFDANTFTHEWGVSKLGIENVSSIVTRGVLLDIAAYKGVDMMKSGEAITKEDVQGALKKQKLTLKPGDVVILHTGWGKLWYTDNATFNKSEPGLNSEAALWLAKQDVAMIGSDTWALEVLPNLAEPTQAFPVHQILLLEHGIHILENIETSELAKDKVYEFMFSLHPLVIEGATASNIAPIAVK